MVGLATCVPMLTVVLMQDSSVTPVPRHAAPGQRPEVARREAIEVLRGIRLGVSYSEVHME